MGEIVSALRAYAIDAVAVVPHPSTTIRGAANRGHGWSAIITVALIVAFFGYLSDQETVVAGLVPEDTASNPFSLFSISAGLAERIAVMALSAILIFVAVKILGSKSGIRRIVSASLVLDAFTAVLFAAVGLAAITLGSGTANMISTAALAVFSVLMIYYTIIVAREAGGLSLGRSIAAAALVIVALATIIWNYMIWAGEI